MQITRETAEHMKESMEIDKTGVHLSHCYQGEEWGWCK